MSFEQELKSVLTSTQKDGANRISKDTVFSLGKSIRCGVRLVYTLLFGEEGNHTSATCSVAFSVTQTRGFREKLYQQNFRVGSKLTDRRDHEKPPDAESRTPRCQL